MSDLFEKLNLLVQAGLRELVGGAHLDNASLRRALTPDRLGKGLEAEVSALRERINQALDYEDELTARVQSLQAEAQDLDAKADEAVARNERDRARGLVEQLQRTQQRVTMAESDLRAHRTVTQELIQRVNMLEAVVADAKTAQQTSSEEDAAEAGTAAPSVADVLRDVRDQVTRAAPQSTTPPTAATDGKAVEDDLERRRQRLSKP